MDSTLILLNEINSNIGSLSQKIIYYFVIGIIIMTIQFFWANYNR